MAGARVLDQEYPDVQATGAPGGDYQHIETTPNMFGGAIAGAEEKLGQGAQQASNAAYQTADFYAHTTINNALNDFMKKGQAIASGDPNNPDTPGYLNTTGAAALSGRATAKQQLDDAYNATYKSLPPYSAQLFAQDARRYQWALGEKMDDHANRENLVYGQTTQRDLDLNFATNVGKMPTDDKFYAQNVAQGTQKIIEYETSHGGSADPEKNPQLKAHLDAFHTSMVESRFNGLVSNDAMAAKDFLEKEKSLGDVNALAYDRMQGRLTTAVGAAAATQEGQKVDAGTATKAATTGAAPAPSTTGTTTPDYSFSSGGRVWNPKTGAMEYATPEAKQAAAAKAASPQAPGQAPATQPATHAAASLDQLTSAFYGQESSSGKNPATSVDNAHGGMQIVPGTFAQYAKPGERLDNPADNMAVGKRILADYAQRYNGDAARIAVAYFSGPGNVAPPGSATPWKNNSHDGNGTFVSQYVDGIMKRLGQPGLNAPAPQSGFGGLNADTGLANPGWDGAAPETAAAAPQAPASPLPGVEPQPSAAAAAAGPPPPAPGGCATGPTVATPAQVSTAEEWRAAAMIGLMNRNDLSPEQKNAGREALNKEYQMRLIAEGSQRQIKAQKADEASAEYTKRLLTGEVAQSEKVLGQIAADPRYAGNPEAMQRMADFVIKWTGKPPDASYGKGWVQARADMLSAPDAPGHISDFQEIYKRAENGDITPLGVSNLYEMKSRVAKDVDTHAYDLIAQKFLEGAKQKLSFEGEGAAPNFAGLKDPEGQQKYDFVFAPQFIEQYSSLLAKAKETGDFKPLKEFLSEKNVNDMAGGIRSQQAYDRARMHALQGGDDISEAPPSVNRDTWLEVASAPPPAMGPDGKLLSKENWSGLLTKLVSDPQTYGPMYDNSYFAKVGPSATAILQQFGVKYKPWDERPDHVAAAPPQVKSTPAPKFGRSRLGSVAPTP